ncbi:MAG: MerR family transcriptional regulator [Bacteroidetes bacterium]|jgi:DNA-binding transcriptional MerR regulator|nr:MerR family transcriptional regulator [Bacteroidota bacterium]
MAQDTAPTDRQDALPSIGAVSDQLGLEPHVLRYWESEFEELSPAKDSAGRRVYRAEDIEMLERIHHLLKVEKYTLEGARQVLAQEPSADAPGVSHDTVTALRRLRAFLMDLVEQIEDADRERGSIDAPGTSADRVDQPT